MYPLFALSSNEHLMTIRTIMQMKMIEKLSVPGKICTFGSSNTSNAIIIITHKQLNSDSLMM